jgi:hypothetical protein
MNVLVVDIGGTNVKILTSSRSPAVSFRAKDDASEDGLWSQETGCGVEV